MNQLPVLIVGAGPTGLSMAWELHRHQIPFRIIDKHSEPVVTSNALAAQTRTLELWDDTGLLKDALVRGNTLRAGNFNFNNKAKLRISFDVLDSLYKFVLGISQHQTETMLIENLEKQGVSIEIGAELTDLSIQENQVTAVVHHANGSTEEITAQWLIACDGGRSVVRSKLNIDFPGKDLEEHFVMADLKIDSELSQHEMYGFFSADGPLFFIQYNNEYSRMIAEVTHDKELHEAKSLTVEQINRVISQRCSVPVKIKEPIWTSGFWIHEKILKEYTHKNVFFAGDAAHVHSPAGGQGMNTGIQDVYNLAWKLALVIKNKAKADILNTYQSERHNVAKAVLRMSTVMTHMVSLKNPLLLWIRNFILVTAFKSAAVRKKMAETISQLAVSYKKGLLVQDCLSGLGQKAGMRMIDVRLNESSRLLDYVRGTQFCLLMLTGTGSSVDEKKFLEISAKISQRYPEMVKVILVTVDDHFNGWQGETILDKSKAIHSCYQVTEASLYLIRPDKYIGFRGKMEHGKELMDYLGGIFSAM